MAEQIKIDFKSNPTRSSLYTTMNYAMLHHFYQQAKNNSFPWLNCLDESQFTNPAFTTADVFKVLDTEELRAFSEKQYDSLTQQFVDKWDGYAQQMSKQYACSLAEIDEDPIHKKNFWECLVGDLTVQLFKQNDYSYLHKYITYIKKEASWGSEEQLNILHAYIQGEMKNNNIFSYSTPISLGIYSNGTLRSGNTNSQSIDIKLNNEDNTHWTSLIDFSRDKNQQRTFGELNRLAQQKTHQSMFCGPELKELDSLLNNLEQQSIKTHKNQYHEDAQHALKTYHLLVAPNERFLSPPFPWLNTFHQESQSIIKSAEKSIENTRAIKKLLSNLSQCIEHLMQEEKLRALHQVNNLEYVLSDEQKKQSGGENGVYHAYNLSLMLFLVRKKDSNFNRHVFTQLNLNDEETDSLNNLLDRTEYTQFSANDVTTIIEPILGPATRVRVAAQIKQNFIDNPLTSSLYILMKYELFNCFYTLNEADPLIENLNKIAFDNFSFSNDRVYAAFTLDQLTQFATEQYPVLKQQFNEGWPNYILSICEKGVFSKEQIEQNAFYKRLFFKQLVGAQTIKFLSDNNYQYLNQYIAYLKTNESYGNAESMLILHSCINETDKGEEASSISLQVNDTIICGENRNESIGIILDEKCVGSTPLTAAFDAIKYFRAESTDKSDILDRYGFNSALEQLRLQITSLEQRKHIKATQQAQVILQKLEEIRNNYLSRRTIELHTFMTECKFVLDNESRTELIKHRGVLKILNNFLNILMCLSNKTTNYFDKKSQPMMFDKISTKTSQCVTNLERSIDALLKMRTKTYGRSLVENQSDTNSIVEKASENPDETSSCLPI